MPWLALSCALLLFLVSGAAAQEIKDGPAADEKPARSVAAEEAPKEEKVPEEPVEILPRDLLPGESRLPSTTLELGPVSGPLAPYTTTVDIGPPTGRAFSVGVFRVRPFLGYDVLYRTNIYGSYTNKVSDVLNLFRPGLGLELPVGTHNFFLNYLGNGFVYSRHGQNDHFDHNLLGGMKLKYPAGTEIQAFVAYVNAVAEQTSTTSQQRPYQHIIPSLQISRRFADKWSLQGNYQLDLYQFNQQTSTYYNYLNYNYNIYNRQTHTGGLTLYYKFWPKTALLFQYLVQFQNYPDYSIGNNFSHTPLVGVTWDPTAKLSGTIKLGYSFKSYDTTIPGRNNNPNNFAMSLQLLYRYSKYTQFSLVAQRSNQNDLDYRNASYENTACYLSWQKNWHYFDITSYVTLSYAFNNYNNHSPYLIAPSTVGFQKKRQDNIYGAWVGLSRPLTKYLKLRLDYRYFNQGSNYPGVSYMQHWAGIGLQSNF